MLLNVCIIHLQPISEIDADGIVVTQNTVHQQILSCQADDLAINDAIFVLGDAFRRNLISTEVYLKRVRNCSRNQFYTRALLNKCREISGVDIHWTTYSFL